MKTSEYAIAIVAILAGVGAIGGMFFYFQAQPTNGAPDTSSSSISYQSQCGSYDLIMTSDQWTNGQLFSTWYNCSNSQVTFNIVGSANGSGYYSNEGGSVGAEDITVAPQATVNVVANVIGEYFNEQISSMTFYAVNYYSNPVVLSPTYSLNT